MKPLKFLLIGCAMVAVSAVVLMRPLVLRTAHAAPARLGGTPVVLELFTSEGCSSCPPADDLLSDLARMQSVPGAHVIVLAEHVDYWNNLGWNDRFSSAAYSARQAEYARQFRLDSVYTPQLVVDGRAQFVGSDKNAALQAISAAASRPKADVRIAAQASGDALSATVTVQGLPQSVQGADVMLAVTESGLSTQVGDGENSGRTLRHTGVVRDLERIGSAEGGITFSQAATVSLKPDWKRDHMQIVAFVQDRATRRIVGAAETGI